MTAGSVLALAGGVGGAKLALGLSRVLPPDRLTVVVNTGDDETFHGLHVSPDVDTVIYTLAGLANPETGWGVKGDTFSTLRALGQLGADTWFWLGDQDLAMHLRRTELLRAGWSLTQVTRELSGRLGVQHRVLPMSDAPVRTLVETDQGAMTFQEYFVRRRCEPRVLRLRFEGAERAQPSPAFLEALDRASAVVLCPSNPFLSIAPILAVPGVRAAIAAVRGPRVAVSPIIGGQAVKGPAAQLFPALAGEPASATAVARGYAGLCTHFVLDEVDAASQGEVAGIGYAVAAAQTLMTTEEDKVHLARVVCEFIGVPAS